MKRFIVIYILFVFGQAFSQNSVPVKNNFEVLKELYSGITSEVCSLVPKNVKNIYLKISSDENNRVPENFLIENIGNLYSVTVKDSSNVLEIIPVTVVQYQNFQEDNDKFTREIKCLISARIKVNNAVQSKNIVKIYSDTLNISDMQSIGHNRINVNKDKLINKNVFDSLLMPVIVLASVGVFVYLLFSIRSN
jgi:hypothetical protein